MHGVLPKYMHKNKHKGDKKLLNHMDKTSISDTRIQNEPKKIESLEKNRSKIRK